MHSSAASAIIRRLMAVRHADVYLEGGREYGRNWALIGLVGMCVEFWVVVAIFLAAVL